MNLVTISTLSKQFSERLLFEDANLLINEGDRIGLIGVNGSGKSTLLKLIAGIEAPDRGAIGVPGGIRIEYVEQEPPLDDRLSVLETLFVSQSPQMQRLRQYQVVTQQLQSHPDDPRLHEQLLHLSEELDRTQGWAAENNAKIVLTKLGIDDFTAQVSTLSGGQRKRVALARALIDRANLLILDEPTNHIDAATVAWLEAYLATAPGALLMVTHDRYFLDRVVNKIVELDRRQLVAYPGNYTHYLEQSEERAERLETSEAKRQNTLRRELEWLRRGAMARGTKQKARKERVLELMEIRYDQGVDRVAIALGSRRLGDKVLNAQNLRKQFGDKVVLDNVNLKLEHGERIGIIGPNGAGKSTMLDILAGRQQPDSGIVSWGDTVQIGYYDQRSILMNEQMRINEFIDKAAPLIKTAEGERIEAAQMLEWFLFPRPMQYARIGSLSGGERRRLYLLHTLIHHPNVLLLDEPTNDLDIQTLAVLEEYLDHFKGCLIVASHDRYFLDRTVDFLVDVNNGKLGPRYPSPYEVYERLRAEANEGEENAKSPASNKSSTNGASTTSARTTTNRKAKPSFKEQRELEAIEIRLAELEQGKATLLTRINQIGTDYAMLPGLSDQLAVVEAELAQVEERWLELS